jgi:hypothetical protein
MQGDAEIQLLDLALEALYQQLRVFQLPRFLFEQVRHFSFHFFHPPLRAFCRLTAQNCTRTLGIRSQILPGSPLLPPCDSRN